MILKRQIKLLFYHNHQFHHSHLRSCLVILTITGFAVKAFQNEHCIPQTLPETPGKIGEPLRSVGNISPHAVTLFDNLFLQIPPYSVKHLEFELFRLNIILFSILSGFFNQFNIMSPNSRVVPLSKKQLDTSRIIFINKPFFLKSNDFRLKIRTFA